MILFDFQHLKYAQSVDSSIFLRRVNWLECPYETKIQAFIDTQDRLCALLDVNEACIQRILRKTHQSFHSIEVYEVDEADTHFKGFMVGRHSQVHLIRLKDNMTSHLFSSS